MNLRAYPLLRIILPFVSGIVIGVDIASSYSQIIDLYPFILIPAIPAVLISQPFSARWLFGIGVCVLFFSMGLSLAFRNDLRNNPQFFGSVQFNDWAVFTGVVVEPPSGFSRKKLVLSVDNWVDSCGVVHSTCGRLMVFLPNEKEGVLPAYGDRLIIRGEIQETRGPKNPHAFNYKRYLRFRNIYHLCYVRPGNWERTAILQGERWWHLAYHYREKTQTILQRYFESDDVYGVALALLLGYKENISEVLLDAYKDTGSMHALAVSGSHIGMIYSGLLLFIRRLGFKGKKGRLLEAVFVLVVIWSFTLLTGATASVLRASLMFSLYLTGKLLNRETSAWNILSFSAWLLLLFNPYFLFDAGFQLSYTAVGGMVFFYPRFLRFFPKVPTLISIPWSLLLIGVSAQIGTLPLSLFYFHQFPVYFWLSGWVVVAGGAIFLWGGFLLLAAHSSAPIIAQWLGLALRWLLTGMNNSIFWIQRLPASVLSGIWVDEYDIIALYVAMALFCFWRLTKYRMLLMSSIMAILVLATWQLQRQIRIEKQRKMVIYDAGALILIDFFDGNRLYTWGDSLTDKQHSFVSECNRWASGSKTIHTILGNKKIKDGSKPTIHIHENVIEFMGRTILVCSSGAPLPKIRTPVPILVWKGDPPQDIINALSGVEPGVIVWVCCRPGKRYETAVEQLREVKIPSYNVRAEGAFTINFKSKNPKL
jgi:competence protein ComEC